MEFGRIVVGTYKNDPQNKYMINILSENERKITYHGFISNPQKKFASLSSMPYPSTLVALPEDIRDATLMESEWFKDCMINKGIICELQDYIDRGIHIGPILVGYKGDLFDWVKEVMHLIPPTTIIKYGSGRSICISHLKSFQHDRV